MITLSIKGPTKSAKRAGARRGVSVQQCKATSGHGVQCKAPCKSLTKVMRWYGDRSSSKTGRGFPPGTLLYFNQGACSSSELRGARRRRRRR